MVIVLPPLRIMLIFFCSLISLSNFAQDEPSARFVFYNVENLFDLNDDTLTVDEEFTPDGAKNWSQTRYRDKIERIAKTITAVGGWELPAIIGLCEVENRNVVLDLLDHRLLINKGYKAIHKDSPDRRGIDVAFLYDPQLFQPISSNWISIRFENEPDTRTRDILHVEGVIFASDTIHVFINHWPSRWGGVEATIPKRVTVANTLREHVDSLFLIAPNANILIAGDLNDNPVDRSVYSVLGAKNESDSVQGALVNLMFPMYENPGEGSLKYKADWETYDQIIVSPALLDDKALSVKDGKAFIFAAPFLLTEDERYLGQKPFRTYAGPSYLNGYSDHLPVFIDLMK